MHYDLNQSNQNEDEHCTFDVVTQSITPPHSFQCLMSHTMTTSQKMASHTFQKIPMIDNGPKKDYP